MELINQVGERGERRDEIGEGRGVRGEKEGREARSHSKGKTTHKSREKPAT